LIYGDTGTGKEVFSRAIHNESNRANKPFIPINCAALPEGLLEGILFGTTKGGFTGAIDRPGLFEQADGGTLLLDEINSMSILLQAKLLRVLQEGVIRRVGGIKDIPVDVRIIATTNEEPYTAIKNGTMRKDLYYRLSVININIPPLRERKEDIPEFIKTFIKTYNDEFSKDVWDIS
ncbi:MAG TPA: sigma-54-dependent Fis family transcriptional regulator, partial [Clostridiaceae bacterium]|nr:sigma-54-dependent Fis family transcriptional regulator [Clostridiaceae bacterium]